MADTIRTRAAILALLADNTTAQISPQDHRDAVVSIMPNDLISEEDFFWVKPTVQNLTTDKTAKGWKLRSQYLGSACSWMNVMFREASTGYWMKADVNDSALNGFLGVAMDSYASDYSTGVILVEGMIYDSTFSTVFSELLGRPIYLDSGIPGSISAGITGNSVKVIGVVMASDDFGGSAIGKWYFKPESWGVTGA